MALCNLNDLLSVLVDGREKVLRYCVGSTKENRCSCSRSAEHNAKVTGILSSQREAQCVILLLGSALCPTCHLSSRKSLPNRGLCTAGDFCKTGGFVQQETSAKLGA